jgi:hypothetical protein
MLFPLADHKVKLYIQGHLLFIIYNNCIIIYLRAFDESYSPIDFPTAGDKQPPSPTVPVSTD